MVYYTLTINAKNINLNYYKIPDHYNDQNRQFLKDYVGIETKERPV